MTYKCLFKIISIFKIDILPYVFDIELCLSLLNTRDGTLSKNQTSNQIQVIHVACLDSERCPMQSQ